MDYASIANYASLATGFASAGCWVYAAAVKVDPPTQFKDKDDGMYHGHIITNGTDLVPTIKAQASWNSMAAFAAAATVILQIAAASLKC